MTKFKPAKSTSGYIEAVPRPPQSELDDFYTSDYFKQGITSTYQQDYSPDELAHKRLRAHACVEAIAQNIAQNADSASFLEIGCGEGFLLSEAAKKGWTCQGVDFQRAPVDKFNPEVVELFEEANPTEYLQRAVAAEKRFDIVVLQNVLEHVLEPKDLLNGIRWVMTTDGTLLIQVPNDYSRIQTRAVKEDRIDREYWFLPPQHLNYFDTATLDAFCGECGFDIIDSFSDFPIEWYLWGAEKNYAQDPSLGPLAHQARVKIDLMIAESGIDSYLDFFRALYNVGMGRSLIVLLKTR